MSFIPEEELKGKGSLNMAPMIDFLFLMLMFFASLAITRITTKDTDIDLVEIKPESHPTTAFTNNELKVININIDSSGEYKWVTEIHDYTMKTPDEIATELNLQYKKGLLPEDKKQTQVLLKIDKDAKWDPILKAIFAIRDAGFEVRPVYRPDENTDSLTAQK